MADLNSILEVSAFGGEGFALGCLYDFRTQKVLPDRTLWNEKTIADYTKVEKNFSADFKVDVSNSFSDRINILDVNSSTKLGILSGLIPLQGFGSYLTASKASKQVSSISLFSKMITRNEFLSDDIIRVTDNVEKDKATHVVTEILYGSRAAFDFQFQDNDEKSPSELFKIMRGAIEKIPDKKRNFTTKEQENTKKLKCIFKSDLYIESIPNTFEEANILFHDLSNYSKENETKAVPLLIKMIPLSQLNNKLGKICKEVSEIRTFEISELFEMSEDNQIRLNGIMNSMMLFHFPHLMVEFEKLKSHMQMGLDHFKSRLGKVISDIRNGTKDETELTHLIEDWKKSPFNVTKLNDFTTNLENYYEILGDILQILHENNNEGKLKRHLSDQNSSIAFAIFCEGKTNTYLSELEKYLRNKETQDIYSTHLEFQDVENAYKRATHFRNSACDNIERNFEFIVYTAKHSLEMDFEIQHYEHDHCEKIDSLPQEVQKIDVTNILANSFDLSWVDNLNSENIIRAYEVSVADREDFRLVMCTKDKSKSMKIKNLKPGTCYHITVTALTRWGFSKQLAIDTKTTLKNSPCVFHIFFQEIQIGERDSLEDLIKIGIDLLKLKEKTVKENSRGVKLITHEMINNVNFKEFLNKWVDCYQCASPQVQEKAKIDMKQLLYPFTSEQLPQEVSELGNFFQIIELSFSTHPNFSESNDNRKTIEIEKQKMYGQTKPQMGSKIYNKTSKRKMSKKQKEMYKGRQVQAIQNVEKITISDISSIKFRTQNLKADNWDMLQKMFLQKVFNHDQQARKLKFPDESPYRSYSDLLITVMARCDEFVLQNLFEKLSDNQFSIPVLCNINGQNKFFLWPLRTIKKSWIIDKVTTIEKFISKHKMKTISFCRVGSLKRFSKSVIINNVMSTCQGWDDHAFFLNKDKENRSTLNRGSIDACFFCPDSRDGEKFNDIHCIYNLRGDALHFPSQFKFISETSSVLIILSEKELTKQERQRLSIDTFNNVLLVSFNKNNTVNDLGMKNKTITIVAGDLNQNDFCDEIVLQLTDNFPPHHLSLEEHSKIAQKLGFVVDEESGKCKYGKNRAEAVMKAIEKIDQTERKEKIVPLQGEHWKVWASKDKEEVRLKWMRDKDPKVYAEEINSEKDKCRQAQREMGISHAMKMFIDEIGKKCSEVDLIFLLEWCQIFLNWTSQEQIFQLQQQYKSAKQKINLRECESDPKSTACGELSELERINSKLSQLSFGLENILRELGQIYECNLKTRKYKFLPHLMAKMMCLGYSLEIMDGDVSHVPVTWVKDVLKNLEQELKPKARIMVLTVLGIQSCGKSTLLNEMFGCKFPVSAGRCTKGVFIQLVQVDEELSQKMSCDFFLIMDAEGLRSPNLSGEFCHDNEIATFVTFLSDLVLITFQGDTLSTEMRDILEIVVHAYARMKEVEIKSFVHLVYLRVSGLNREDKNLGIEQNMIKELDKMSMKIASLENQQDLAGGFSAVFKVLKDHYRGMTFEQTLPSLWMGNMRVPESRFGQLAGELRDSICRALMEPNENSFRASELSFFITQLDNTWKAIKAENFVLNFKNTKQIDSYRKLEKEYYRLKDDLWAKFVCQSSHVSLTKAQWLSFKNEEMAIKYVSRSFESKVNLCEDNKNVDEKLSKFIHTLEDPDFASRYHKGLMEDLSISIKDWIYSKKQDIIGKIKLAYVEQNMPSIKDYKKHLKKEASCLATDLKRKTGNFINEKVITEEFNGWFQKELSKAKAKDDDNIKVDSFHKVEAETFSMLQEELSVLKVPVKTPADAKHILGKIKETKETSLAEVIIKPKNHLKKDGIIQNMLQRLKGEPTKKEMEIISLQWERRKSNILKSFEKETSKTYDHLNPPEIIKKVLTIAKEELENFEQNNFRFTGEFKWEVLVTFYGFSVKRIAVILKEYIARASHSQNLEKMKESLLSDFRRDCETLNQSLRMGEKFADLILMDAIVCHIQVSKGKEICDYLKETPELSTKSETTFKMLEELLDVETSEIIDFFHSYKTYAENWISEKALIRCVNNNYLRSWLEKQIASCVSKLTSKLNDLVASNQENNLELGTWYEALNSSLMDEKDDTNKFDLKVTQNEFLKLFGDDADISVFVGETIRLINETKFKDDVFKAIFSNLNNTSSDAKWIMLLNWLEFKPLDCLKDQLLGCTDQCPLCGAVCDGGVACKNEKTRSQAHFTEIHLPIGISSWHDFETRRLVSGICSVEVCGSDKFNASRIMRERFRIQHYEPIPYKEANTIFKGIWRITPDTSSEATRFWKFLFVKHHQRIAEIEKLKEANDIPQSWYNITREDALENLKDVKNQI